MAHIPYRISRIAHLPLLALVTLALAGADAAPALPPPVRGITYQANDAKGVVFRMPGIALTADGTVRCTVEGPGAADAAVSAKASPLPHGVALDWSVRCAGPKREWNPWTSGFRLEFAGEVTSARTQAVTRWVRPTGAHAWEVPGDTPYPDTAGQLREVFLGDRAVVIVTSIYDPDWIYGGNKARAPSIRLAPPADPGGEATLHMAILSLPARDLDAARLAAEGLGQPLALSLGTGRLGNLFRPGEEAAVECRVSNVTGAAQRATLAIEAWSYRGENLWHTQEEVCLPALRQQVARKRIRLRERGLAFVAARLSWEGGEALERTTLGFLPERRANGTRPDSPFALAAVTANPERYPDQLPLGTVLPLVERIGARWLRWGGVPLKSDLTAADEAKVARQVALLARHGVLGYAHTGCTVPKAEERETFEARVSATVRKLRWGNPFLEIGNELNFSTSAPDYVQRMLQPIHRVMRRDWPEGKIVSMGLGGVMKPWFDDFVKAGGMELIDVLSVHPGCHPRAPEYYENWEGWVFRTQMRDAMHAAQRTGKAVWIDEAYSPTPPTRSQVDLRTSADYLVRTYVCSIALGVQRIAWYQFQDGVWHSQRPNPLDMEYSYGIVYTDLTPKPAYVAYAAMTEQLEGALCLGRLDLGAEDLYGFRFLKEGKPVDVLWSYREKHETDFSWWPPEKSKGHSRKPAEPWQERWMAPAAVSLPAAGAVTLTDLMGNHATVQPVAGRIALKLTGSPVYVRGLGEIPRLPKVWPEMP